jgi:hypothetical protein
MSTPRKIWLCGITCKGNEQNLRELITPCLPYINGLNWVFHYPTDSGADYLESVKGEGKIVYTEWAQRHHFSQNHYLYNGTIQPNDIFLQIDTEERISEKFFKERLPEYIEIMDRDNISMIANYQKGFVYKFNEEMEYAGSPHWYMTKMRGGALNDELPHDYFKNVRLEKRPERYFVKHYVKYYLYPAGSNSAALGLDRNGNPQDLFPIVESRRIAFREELRKRNIPLTVDGVMSLFDAPMDEVMKGFFNNVKELNDLYREYVLKDSSFPDDHDFKNMVIIK